MRVHPLPRMRRFARPALASPSVPADEDVIARSRVRRVQQPAPMRVADRRDVHHEGPAMLVTLPPTMRVRVRVASASRPSTARVEIVGGEVGRKRERQRRQARRRAHRGEVAQG